MIWDRSAVNFKKCFSNEITWMKYEYQNLKIKSFPLQGGSSLFWDASCINVCLSTSRPLYAPVLLHTVHTLLVVSSNNQRHFSSAILPYRLQLFRSMSSSTPLHWWRWIVNKVPPFRNAISIGFAALEILPQYGSNMTIATHSICLHGMSTSDTYRGLWKSELRRKFWYTIYVGLWENLS